MKSKLEPMYTNIETKMSFLMKFSSLAAPKIVILTTFGAASEEIFIKMTFPFQRMIQETRYNGILF